MTYLCLIKNECILDVLVASIYFSREDDVNSLLLIIEDLTRLNPMVFPFASEGFFTKNLAVLLVAYLIYFSTTL